VIYRGEFVEVLDGQIQQRARDKSKYLEAATSLEHQRLPPGNQLEALKGGRKGQYSTYINEQSTSPLK